MRTNILFILMLALASPAFANHELAGTAESIADFLSTNPNLSDRDVRAIDDNLDRIGWLLADYGYERRERSPFRFEQVGDQLKVFARDTGTQLYTWNKHAQMTVRGPVLALLDSEHEFAAIRYEAGKKTVLVEKWRDTVEYVVNRDYIGIVDSKGIAEMYSTHEAKKLVKDWRNTVQYAFMPRYAVLRDNEADRNMSVYDAAGNLLVKQKGVDEFSISSWYLIEYTQDGTTKSIDIRNYLP